MAREQVFPLRLGSHPNHHRMLLVGAAMTDDLKGFDEMYGPGMLRRVQAIINDLAPTTRRDQWWETAGPYEIIAMHLMRSEQDEQPDAPADAASTHR
jgi:hypothetical protein